MPSALRLISCRGALRPQTSNRTPITALLPSRSYKISSSRMASIPSSEELKIENTNIKTSTGVTLDDTQKTLIGSVLDLFAGRPSLQKLQLWNEDAVFEDPITIAQGRKKFEPQWYGLPAAFSQIERLHHEVTSAGNPIAMDLKTRYVIKGINKEQIIESKVNIHYDPVTKRITKVVDKWNGNLPEGPFATVSFPQRALSVWYWTYSGERWAWWCWSFVWDTWPWQAFRKLNAVTVPHLISVPKNDAEDIK